MKHRTSIAFSFAICATFALAASSSSRWEHVPARDHQRANPMIGHTEAVEAGGLIYREHCLQCHKADAMGDGPKRPALRSPRLKDVMGGGYLVSMNQCLL